MKKTLTAIIVAASILHGDNITDSNINKHTPIIQRIETNISSRSNYKMEIEYIEGKNYFINFVPKKDIAPAFGYSYGDSTFVRDDLPPRVKQFVKAHELYHCRDKSRFGGWFGHEVRANLIPGLKDPIGLSATIYETITDKDRISFYFDRVKKGY